ncbi:lipase family protein [Gordonia sp. NPDC003376]
MRALMRTVVITVVVGVVAVVAGIFLGSAPAAAAPRPTSQQGAGSVVESTDITNQPNSRMAGAGRVIAVTYLSEDSHGELVPVRATVSIPERNPRGGAYRIHAWGHGTSGLGDQCTVTDRMGTKIDGKGRWDDWFGPWLNDGYVLVATEYAGLGGPGVHAYADGEMQGKNMIDSVRAARTVIEQYTGETAGTEYLTSGGSQGGQTAVWAGHLAPTYAPELTNVGIAAQSVPVDTSRLLAAVAPGMPPVEVPDYVTYVSYVLAGTKVARPDIDVDSYLTPLGKKVVDDAQTLCYPNQGRATKGLTVGQLVAKPLSEGPLLDAVQDLVKVPDTGYRAPMLIQQGLFDLVAPAPLTSAWVDGVRAGGGRVDYREYQATHGLGAYAEEAARTWANGLAWSH